MFVKCSTCLESISPSDDLASAPCGHIFHFVCILQWLNTGKATCPQCREPCKQNQLRKVFFSESDDIGSPSDANELQSKIDSLTFNLRLAEKESKKYKEEAETSKAQAVSLREEFRDLERERNALNGKIVDLKTQVRYLQAEGDKVQLLKNELKETKDNLKLYQNVELVVKGTVSEVNKKLHEIGDYSQASKELGILLVALKRELEASKSDNTKYKSELRKHASTVKELKSSLSLQAKEVKELTLANSMLSSDLKHAEQEKETLKGRIGVLKDAMQSPSGNVQRSTMNRIMSELPLPQDLEETQFHTPSPLKVKTKSCNLIGLKREADPEENENEVATQSKKSCMTGDFNIFKTSRLNSNRGGIFSKLDTESFNNIQEKFYNGFGGHDKLDTFPSGKIDSVNSIGKNISKRPRKGLAKMTISNKLATSKSIDKYFKLDTP